jgi:hypothetical protein
MQASHCEPEAPREADPLGKTHLICQGADLDKIADTESEAHPVLVVEVSSVAMKCVRKVAKISSTVAKATPPSCQSCPACSTLLAYLSPPRALGCGSPPELLAISSRSF